MSFSPKLSTGQEGERSQGGLGLPSESQRYWLAVALDVPLAGLFDYWSATPASAGQRVLVTFGHRKMVGMVAGLRSQPAINPTLVKPVEQVLDDLPPMPDDWLRLAGFAARYYHRPLGEVMLPSLPVPLRKVSAYTGKGAGAGPVAKADRKPGATVVSTGDPVEPPELNEEQQSAVNSIAAAQGNETFLLHGVTGSGKTEVYLAAALQVLAKGRQVLFMVPEINLTPQFEQTLRSRLATLDMGGNNNLLAVLHSGLADGQRLRAWLRVTRGEARVLLGTRLALMTPMPELGLIIVDEEHDTSYKQQDGLRYSARDLAVWRARDLGIPVVLGSATPSLESWHNANRGQYTRLSLTHRARDVQLPAVRLVDTRRLEMQQGFSPQLLEAITDRLKRKEQVLIFLNRRGYSPVISCSSCGWVSNCPRCSAYTTLHRLQGRRMHHHLQCHHCGYHAPVPRRCPDCGDQDLKPMGRGTQRVEEYLAEWFPAARISRIDADTTRLKGSAEVLFAQVHAGDVDILVGTQMVAKGHDFARLGLVGVLNADTMLFAQDFRAPERLFAQLMQVAGRAGRHSAGGEVIIQTDYPEQPVYQALIKHDYQGFARYSLEERESVGLPPFAYQALLTAEAASVQVALDFLSQAARLPETEPDRYPGALSVTRYDPVPLRIVRVANTERAQLLVESTSRPALQAFLTQWGLDVAELASQHRIRCHLEVDPLEI